jgi:hypothetical protein
LKYYYWSPQLKAAINTLTYWKLRLSQLKGKIISQHTLSKIFHNTQSATCKSLPQPLASVIQEVRQARATLKDVQRRHIELREQYLEDLAEAIILHKRPRLLEPGREKDYERKKHKEI